MGAAYRRWSLVFGIPGIALQMAGSFLADLTQQDLLGGICFLFGTVLLVMGLSYYAQAKGRNHAWCFLGLLSIVGLLVLVALEDRSGPAPVINYRHRGLALGVLGIVLQVAGSFKADSQQQDLLGVMCFLFGTVLLVMGLSYYAQAKGRNHAWCFMGLLSIVGLLVLIALKDRSGPVWEVGGVHD